jgi:hypothetical protein
MNVAAAACRPRTLLPFPPLPCGCEEPPGNCLGGCRRFLPEQHSSPVRGAAPTRSRFGLALLLRRQVPWIAEAARRVLHVSRRPNRFDDQTLIRARIRPSSAFAKLPRLRLSPAIGGAPTPARSHRFQHFPSPRQPGFPGHGLVRCSVIVRGFERFERFQGEASGRFT